MTSKVIEPSPFNLRNTSDEEATDLASILDEIRNLLERYIVFPIPGQSAVIALWIAHTWTFRAFDFTPYLHIYSPEKRCGKSHLLDLIGLLAAGAWQVVCPTSAVLFRMIQAERPTVLLDEADTIFTRGSEESKEPLRAVLNAGFERGATVSRCDGPNHELRKFEVFTPKALAGIGRLPDTISDRCIPILLARRSASETVERLRKRQVKEAAAPIVEKLKKWAQIKQTISSLSAQRPAIPSALGDRQMDICEPLLAIAGLASEKWKETADEALVNLCVRQSEDDSIGVKLLSAIRTVFDEQDVDRISTRDLLENLISQETEAPWATWWEESVHENSIRGPSTRLARLLKPFGIRARVIRLSDTETARGYTRVDFQETWSRYCDGLSSLNGAALETGVTM